MFEEEETEPDTAPPPPILGSRTLILTLPVRRNSDWIALRFFVSWLCAICVRGSLEEGMNMV